MSEVYEAINAYHKAMRRKGFADFQISQPSQHSDVLADRVLLSNCRGYLATYHLHSHRVTWSQRDKGRVERAMYA